MTQSPYKRVLLKLSGQALQGEQSFGISAQVLKRVATEIAQIKALGVQLGVVIGAGNFFRGATLSETGLERITGDHMGMLATVMNALAMRDTLEDMNLSTRVVSAIAISGIAELYDRRKAINLLEEDKIVFFGAGTGNPLVTTDSAASLRAIEVKADILLKATDVDGIYQTDPSKDPNAEKYSKLTYSEALTKELGVMDLAAFCQCRDHGIALRVFNINKPGAMLRIIQGEDEGTLVHN